MPARCIPTRPSIPSSSVPDVVRRINRAFQRADQIQPMEGEGDDRLLRADRRRCRGRLRRPAQRLRADEGDDRGGRRRRAFRGPAASEKKCGHLGGKVLVPMQQFIRTLNAARLAADVEGVPTVLLARTDADSAQLLTTDIDERDRQFLTGERTAEGFFRIKPGVGQDYAIARGLAYAEYADLLWWETSEPDLAEARRFAEAIRHHFPGKLLAYNCSPSFNWQQEAGARSEIAEFQSAHRGDGLQVPVRDARRLPRAQSRHVRAGARLSRARHGGLFRAAGGGVRRRSARLHRDAPSARGRHRLFRRGGDGGLGRQVLDRRMAGSTETAQFQTRSIQTRRSRRSSSNPLPEAGRFPRAGRFF